MRLVVANVVLFMFLDCIRRKLRNPWMPLAELLGSAEARLKNTGLHHMMSISINIDAVEQKSKLQLVAVTLLTANQLSQLLAHTHDRKLATGGYIVSPPNMVCVTALQGNILITSLLLALYHSHLPTYLDLIQVWLGVCPREIILGLHGPSGFVTSYFHLSLCLISQITELLYVKHHG